MIENEVDRCKRIARDLLAFSRPPPSEKGPVDLQETVDETLNLAIRVLEECGVYLLAVVHEHEHLGQLIAYARTNGVVPPWSASAGGSR